MKTPESYEKDEIKKYLKSIGAWYFSPFMAGFGKSGVPDIICCIEGTLWGLEVKREGKSPTTLQQHRISEIKAAGGQATWGVAAKVCADINRWRKSKKEQATIGL
jgi:hypothetical protein